MTLRIHCIFFLLGALFVTQAKAQQPSPSPTLQFKIVKGQPVQISFPDGRVAEIELKRGTVTDIAVPFGVKDDSCAQVPDGTPLGCFLRTWFANDSIALIWRANPKRKGLMLQRPDDPSGYPFQQGLNTSSENIALYYLNDPRLKKMRLFCDSYSWMPGGTKTNAPAKFEVPSWANEEERPNNETNGQEIGLAGTYSNVEFNKDVTGQLHLQSIYSVSGSYTFMLPISIPGFTVSQDLTIQKPDGGLCQATLIPEPSAEVNKLVSQFTAMNQSSVDGYNTYLYGTDSYIDAQIRIFVSPTNYLYTVVNGNGGNFE